MRVMLPRLADFFALEEEESSPSVFSIESYCMRSSPVFKKSTILLES